MKQCPLILLIQCRYFRFYGWNLQQISQGLQGQPGQSGVDRWHGLFRGVLFEHAWHPDSISQGTKVEEGKKSFKAFLPSAKMESDILIDNQSQNLKEDLLVLET